MVIITTFIFLLCPALEKLGILLFAFVVWSVLSSLAVELVLVITSSTACPCDN